MSLQFLDKVCFTICIVCIVAGTVLSLAMIWGEIHDNAVVWKCWGTIVVLILASALALAVSKTFAGRGRPRGET
jgi:uncharacterized membrane protein